MVSASLFDKILNHKKSNYHIVANPYLHILGYHPELLRQYHQSKMGRLWLLTRFKLIVIVRIVHSIFGGRQRHFMQEKNVKSDVLFVSHLTNIQQLSQDEDAYFGNLPSLLLRQGVSSSVALLKHVTVSNQQVLEGWKGGQIPRFVLGTSLDFLSEIKIYFAQTRSKKQLRSILKDLQVDKTLVKDILCHHLSSGTFNAIRIAQQISDIANQVGAKFIITTYEGHAWERLVYYHSRKINPNIKCAGYQHAAIFENQHAIIRPLGKAYNPNIILTPGLVAKNIFEKKQLKGSEIACMGSSKYSSSNITEKKSQSCLVVPEGFVSECLILFKVSLKYSKKYRNQRFIWRLHPSISFNRLKQYSSIFENLPNNIHLSVGSLDDDILKCDSVLYRGSTAVVNAINAGLKPIYYQQSSDELSIDSIYTHKKGKSIVHNQEELGLALDRDIDVKTMQSLHDFAQDFYTPLDANALLKLL